MVSSRLQSHHHSQSSSRLSRHFSCYHLVVFIKDKKMILVMDNAAYHLGREDDYKSPSQMNKADATAALRMYGIISFTCKRKQADCSEKEFELMNHNMINVVIRRQERRYQLTKN
jgi:hypothetical protein